MSRTAVLLVNLGTPEAPTPKAISKFLFHFLSDRRVVDLPRILWKAVLHLILPFRSIKVSRMYQAIWRQEGSPLKIYTERLSIKLENALNEMAHNDFNSPLKASNTSLNDYNAPLNDSKYKMNNDKIPVFYAMTYSTPSITNVLRNILQNNKERITQLIVLPLFPQYSKTTTAAVWDKLTHEFKRQVFIPSIHFINEYANEVEYQKALAESITTFWSEHPKSERLLFSFHGVPKAIERGGDTYVKTCKNLAQAIAKILNIPENSYEISFQSRFGFSPWSEPQTAHVLSAWGALGIQSVDVISPSFAVDCLETLEELDKQMRKLFYASGGKCYQYIPALNDSDSHIRVLKKIIQKFF